MRDVNQEQDVVPLNRAWAVFRIGLGLAQMMGATITLFLLLRIGVTNLTVWATAATLSLTVLSKLMFARMDRKL